MPFVAVPDKNSGDTFTTAMWTTYLEGNLNAGVDRPLFDSGILGVSAASIVISSIPQTFAALRLVFYARGDTVADTVNAALRFNGDTGANYVYENLLGLNAAAGTSAATASSGVIGAVSAGSAAANTFGMGEVLIPNYVQAGNQKGWVAVASVITGANTTAQIIGGRWVSNAAITSVTILPTSGSFVAGTRVILYGLGSLT